MHRSCLVPPLPSKERQKKRQRFTPAFLERRRAFLERFLRRISVHPKLSKSKDFYVFLEATKWVRLPAAHGR